MPLSMGIIALILQNCFAASAFFQIFFYSLVELLILSTSFLLTIIFARSFCGIIITFRNFSKQCEDDAHDRAYDVEEAEWKINKGWHTKHR